MDEIESDLRVIHQWQPRAHRIFLTGANPFVLSVSRLTDIALLIRKYVNKGHPTIGCFSRITDIRPKSVEELQQLRYLGFDFLTIGVESGHSDTLMRANKGYKAEDVIEQCQKLEKAGIRYNIFYIAGLAGHGKGIQNALHSANVFNQLNPACILMMSLTIFPESQLYHEMQIGEFQEPTEYERIDEMVCLIKNLNCHTHIMGRTVSNPVPFTGYLPTDRWNLLKDLQMIKDLFQEEELKAYRNRIDSFN